MSVCNYFLDKGYNRWETDCGKVVSTDWLPSNYNGNTRTCINCFKKIKVTRDGKLDREYYNEDMRALNWRVFLRELRDIDHKYAQEIVEKIVDQMPKAEKLK